MPKRSFLFVQLTAPAGTRGRRAILTRTLFVPAGNISSKPNSRTRTEERERFMSQRQAVKVIRIAAFSFTLLALFTTAVFAQNVKVQGLIKGRSGATMTLQTSDTPQLVVLLTDATQVKQVQGMLKARRKEMSMAALIPGLAVQVEGAYNDQNQLV